MDEQPSSEVERGGFENKPYFITICTFGRELTLGKLQSGRMELNETGLLVEEEWLFIGDNNDTIALDAYCIMPNHFHAILWLVKDPDLRNKGLLQLEEGIDPDRDLGAILVGNIIERFKATVTDRVNTIKDTPGNPFWQPSYHGHVIGSDKAVPAMRRYVNDNPVNWSRDLMNPLVSDPSCLIPADVTSSK